MVSIEALGGVNFAFQLHIDPVMWKENLVWQRHLDRIVDAIRHNRFTIQQELLYSPTYMKLTRPERQRWQHWLESMRSRYSSGELD